MSTPAQHEHGHCLKARLLPSGEVILVCQHSGEKVVHFGRSIYIEKLSHSTRNHNDCFLKLSLKIRVPLDCDAGESFELVGGHVDAEGCNCHEQAEPKQTQVEDDYEYTLPGAE